MVEPLQQVQGMAANAFADSPFSGMPSVEIIILFVIGFLFLLAGGVVMFIFINRWRWPYKVIIFENVSGAGYQPSGRDRARMVKFGDGGEEIFYLKKRKLFRAAYGKRIGTRYIAWAIGEDGFWYNIVFGNVDKRLMELGVNPVDRDQRLTHSAMRKGIENRYNQKTFFEKWGAAITIGVLIVGILIQGAVIWFNLQQQAKITASNAQAMETVKEVMTITHQIMGNANIVKQGGAGIIPTT